MRPEMLFTSQPRKVALAVVAATGLLFALGLATLHLAGGTGELNPGVLLVPVLVLSFYFGPLVGILAAVAVGVLAGPFLPLSPGVPQQTADWALRIVIYGVCAGLVGTFSVVTRRQADRLASGMRRLAQQMEERGRLEESLRWHSLAITHIGEGVCITDANGAIVFSNKALHEMLGYDPQELTGQPISRLYPEGEKNRTLMETMEALHSAHWSGEALLLAKDGTCIPTFETASALRDEGQDVIGYVCTNADLRERKRIEDTLTRISARLGQALAAGRMGVWEWDLVTGEVTWVGQEEAPEGFLPRLFGSLSQVLQQVHPEDRDRVAAEVAKAREQGAPLHVEFRVLLPDGAVRWVDAKGVVTVDKTGKPVRLTGGATDITRQKRVEAELAAQIREREALASVLVAMSGATTLEASFQAVVHGLRDMLPAHHVALVLLSADRTTLEITASTAESGPFAAGATFRLDQCASSQALRENRILVRSDLLKEATYEADFHAVAAGFHSHMVTPLILGDKWYGTIHVLHREAGVYAQRDADCLGVVGHQVAVHLHRALLLGQLSEELARGRRRIEAFQSAAARLVLAEDIEGALQELVDLARDLVGSQYGALAIWNARGDMAHYLVSGLAPEAQRRMSRPSHTDDVVAFLREKGTGLRLADVSTHPRFRGFPANHPAITSFLGVPVVSKGRADGAIYLVNKVGTVEFSEDDERLLGLFAVTAGVLLQNADLYRAIADEQRTLSAVVSGMMEGLAVLDGHGYLRVWNGALADLTGLPAGKVLGTTAEQLLGNLAANVEDARALGAIRRALDGEDGPGQPIDLVLMRPQPRDLQVRVFRTHLGPAGNLTGFLVRNATHEKEIERRRDRFVSVASHELRTPMTTILGLSELLLDQDPPQPRRKEWAEHIYRDAQRLSAIVDDLLSVSKIQTGQVQLRLTSVSLVELVRSVCARMERSTDHHRIIVTCDEGTPAVVGDRDKLEQVLANLLDNAIKYSPGGGRVDVAVRTDPSKSGVTMSVADEGIGIAPEDRAGLFTPFARIHRPETLGIRGTGLGLYIIKNLVAMMGGDVWLESEVGKGTTFHVSLPVAQGGRAMTNGL